MKRFFLLLWILLVTNVFAVSSGQAAPDDNWVVMNVLPGTDGEIRAVAVRGTDVYIGGVFTMVGNTYARNIAHWNGSEWSALNTGTNAGVNALAVDSKGNLYAGGEFASAGGVTVNHLAVWNGSSWAGIDGGMSGAGESVNALLFDRNGNLFVGGSFLKAGLQKAARVAMWNGNAWTGLGSGFNASVNALALDSVGNLYAGGDFSKSGELDVSRIARWDGVAWRAMDGGLGSQKLATYQPPSSVYSLLVDNKDIVYVAGNFNIAAGRVRTNNLARWDGKGWSAMGDFSKPVNALMLDAGGNLVVGGEFVSIDGNYLLHAARWSAIGWTSLGSGFDGNVKALALDGNGDVLAGGKFTSAGSKGATNLAIWSNSDWHPVVNGGIDGRISAMVSDARGNVYVGGQFRSVPGINQAYYVAHWNGHSWRTLGAGMDGGVRALALDKSGNLYAGGEFEMAGGTVVNGVAHWDGTAWIPLGNGMDDTVYALAVDGLGNVYAGGAFTLAGTVEVSNIARWNGTDWRPMSGGLDDVVYTLAVDSKNNVYAGGDFMESVGAGSMAGIARWNGAGWKALGNGLDGSVEALLVDSRDNLYAGGFFFAAGDNDDASFLAKWDGAKWNALGTGVDGPVSALALDLQGNLFIGGFFSDAGGVLANSLAKWNGSSWSGTGSGLDDAVSALAIDMMGNVLVGGEFFVAGGKLSPFLAQWVPDFDGDGVNDYNDAFPGNAAAASDADKDGFADGWIPGNPYGCVATALTCNGLTLDKDDDNDRVQDTLDNCRTVPNPDQRDTNGDGLGDACDLDSDGIENAMDNCPLQVNLDQLDTDGDWEGNACDADDDNDGVPDEFDVFPLVPDNALILGEFSAGLNKDRVGRALAFAGDVNADGYGDYVIGLPAYDVPGYLPDDPDFPPTRNGGRAVVLSGVNGSVLMSVDGLAENDSMGSAVAGNADVDLDGYADVIVGAPFADDELNGLIDAGSVTILYGPDGDRQQTFYGATSRALAGSALALGDVNGDFYPDIVIGAPKDDYPLHNLADAGSVKVLSGNGFYVINTFYGVSVKAYAGTSVAVGDVNRDGLGDVVIGAPNDDDRSRQLVNSGSVSVYTKDGVLLLKKSGATAKAAFGKAVAVGDVNNDGFADVVAGAPGDRSFRNSGSVTVFRGNTGQELAKYYGSTAKAALGNSVATGDIDGDGTADVMAGAWKEDASMPSALRDAGSVSFWSVSKQQRIGTLYGKVAKEYFGSAVALGDINNDGFADLIIGSSNQQVAGGKMVKNGGGMKVFSGAAWGL